MKGGDGRGAYLLLRLKSLASLVCVIPANPSLVCLHVDNTRGHRSGYILLGITRLGKYWGGDGCDMTLAPQGASTVRASEATAPGLLLSRRLPYSA
jgi:hypothetical protein